MKTFSHFLVAFFTALTIFSVPSAAEARSTQYWYDKPDRFEKRVLYFTNQYRKSENVEPLRHGKCADKFAERWSHRMARQTKMYHQSLSPLLECSNRVYTAGENVAYTPRKYTARQLVNMWWDSPGHKANMLNPNFTHIGIGSAVSRKNGMAYHTQDFIGNR